MNPIRKLSKNVKSLLSASNQVNSFLKAVQELVYNSLDANATSIAVRLHIEEGSIQVVDNGCGINKSDYKVLGHSHFTSKVTDIFTLKSMPNTYGYRGQALASIVQVSKCVKITSRGDQSEDTFMKVFEYGKEKEIVGTKTRPSVGTTVDVKGFLYNLSIQKKSTNNITNLEEIKYFLQHTSLVKYNISMSLRDDSTNEIVFKIHKNRDIYQTLSSLFDIQQSDVQELQVEKNQYKVSAYIGKNNNEILKHLVFLNGKLLSGFSKIHKIVTQNLSKCLKIEKTDRRKNKKVFDKEEKNNDVPFYLIFLKCPYTDYDLNITSKYTIVDFKDWSQISKLLDKLIRFYIGDITIREADKNLKTIERKTKNKNADTRNQVKRIIDRILGSKQIVPQVSQMHNGVKGKQATRKSKKKLRIEILPSKSKIPNHVAQKLEKHYPPSAFSESRKEVIESPTSNFDKEHNNKVDYKPVSENKQLRVPVRKSTVTPVIIGNKKKKTYVRQSPILKSKISQRKNLSKGITAPKPKKKKIPVKTIPLLSKFINPTDSVQQRYNAFVQISNINNNKRTFRESNHRHEVIIKETVEYENSTKNRTTSVRAKVKEVIVKDIFPIPNRTTIFKPKSYESKEISSLLSTRDILNTVLNSQPKKTHIEREKDYEINKIQNQEITPIGQNNNLYHESPVITFQSHNYENKEIGLNYFSHDGNNVFSPVARDVTNLFKKSKAFLSKKSIENFAPTVDRNKMFKRKPFKKKNWLKDTLKKAFNNMHYTRNSIKNAQASEKQSLNNIQYSESDNCSFSDYNHNTNIIDRQLSSFTMNTEQPISAYTTLNHTPQFIDLSNNQLISHFLFESDEFLRTVNKEFENTVLDSHTNQNIDLCCDRLINNGTYTIENNSYNEVEPRFYDVGNDNEQIMYATYTVDPKSNSIDENRNMIASNDEININTIDVSSIKSHNEQISDPIEVCETIMDSYESLNNEFANSFNIRNDSLNMLVNNENSDNADNLEINDEIDDIDLEQISHHFTIVSNIPDLNTASANKMDKQLHVDNNNKISKLRLEKLMELDNSFNFNIEDRFCFLPKGMSQIFKNCNTKAVTENQNLNEDYYEDRIYNEFAHKVQNTVEIFEPRIQEASDLVTKDIDKVNNKLKKDTASLKFVGESLKSAKVLGQVDQKFIAAVIKGIDESSSELEFLVLFDQHAVHERIRLEANLSDYLTDGQWKSVSLDEVTLKMSSDEIRFLHNFKEKFTQFGLQWNILNSNEISLTTIPEAVLGKNTRSVDKIIRAVQSLMKEIINTIKLQSGCVSIYPKSIMELVFSESCRYAIKFGDKLSKTECTELLRNLSECKTPFQCAHGRPVMAVLMDIKPIDVNYYKICAENIKKIKKTIHS